MTMRVTVIKVIIFNFFNYYSDINNHIYVLDEERGLDRAIGGGIAGAVLALCLLVGGVVACVAWRRHRATRPVYVGVDGNPVMETAIQDRDL